MGALKLGKTPASYDRQDLRFADFVKPKILLRSAAVGFGVARAAKVGWQMLGNGPDDTVAPGFQGAGDCVEADACNRVIYSNAIAGKPIPPFTGKEAIGLYEAITGYRPGDESTDRGTDMRTALNYARKTGVTDADGVVHKIGGYCALEAGSWSQLLQALSIFDVVSIGIAFPQSAMDQFTAGKAWSYVKGSPVDGGHDVLVTTRPREYQVGVQTWARTQPMTSSFYRHLCDEAFGIFLPESLDKSGRSPEGFALADFTAALAAL